MQAVHFQSAPSSVRPSSVSIVSTANAHHAISRRQCNSICHLDWRSKSQRTKNALGLPFQFWQCRRQSLVAASSNTASGMESAESSLSGEAGTSETEAVSKQEEPLSEEEANKKREEESKAAGVLERPKRRPPRGGDPPPPGSWSWTLNWDPICTSVTGAEIIVGSCPRTAEDVVRLKREAGIEAIVCLQSDMCFDAMEIDIDGIREKAAELDILHLRAPVYDFNRLDQAGQLPEMTRKVDVAVTLGRKTYVHCTAGINRANLTVLGYLTFVEGYELDDALKLICESRPQANPYVESWTTARSRLLAERGQDLYCIAKLEGEETREGDWIKRDWTMAEKTLIQRSIQRGTEAEVLSIQAAFALGKSPTAALSLAAEEPPVPPDNSESQTEGDTPVISEENGTEASKPDPEPKK